MKACFLAMLTLLCSIFPRATPLHGKTVIAYAKSIDVQTLDPSLPSQRLEDWLQAGPPHAHIRWEVADTCDNKPDSDEDYPLCAKIWFSRNGEAGSFLTEVGTSHKGMDGHAQLYSGIIGREEGPGWIMTGGAEQLSGLPARLDQPAFAHGVGQLYGEIVAHHPVGIPADAKMVSKRFVGATTGCKGLRRRLLPAAPPGNRRYSETHLAEKRTFLRRRESFRI